MILLFHSIIEPLIFLITPPFVLGADGFLVGIIVGLKPIIDFFGADTDFHQISFLVAMVNYML